MSNRIVGSASGQTEKNREDVNTEQAQDMSQDNGNIRRYEQMHQTIQSTVDKMYSRIANIIESARDLVSNNPEDGEEIVQYITEYTSNMHNIIEEIVQAYSDFLQSSEQDIMRFKGKVTSLVDRAKRYTKDVQTLIG